MSGHTQATCISLLLDICIINSLNFLIVHIMHHRRQQSYTSSNPKKKSE
jgi:hypothetical protein